MASQADPNVVDWNLEALGKSSNLRHDATRKARHGLHHPSQKTLAARDHIWSCAQMSEFVSGLKWLRRGPWEKVASVLIAMGVVMLMQPFFLGLYTYSFLVTLIGTVMFIIVSHFPE